MSHQSTTSLKKVIGRLLPRKVRSSQRSPRCALRPRRLDRRLGVQCSMAPGMRFTGPRTAIQGAFHLQVAAPRQAVDFTSLITRFRDTLLLDIDGHNGLRGYAVVAPCGGGSRAVAGGAGGETETTDGGGMSTGHRVFPTDPRAQVRTTVPVVTIDELSAAGDRTPGQIKIDVESFDGEMIAGGPGSLTGRDPIVRPELRNRRPRDRGAGPAPLRDRPARHGCNGLTCHSWSCPPGGILAPKTIGIGARRAHR